MSETKSPLSWLPDIAQAALPLGLLYIAYTALKGFGIIPDSGSGAGGGTGGGGNVAPPTGCKASTKPFGLSWLKGVCESGFYLRESIQGEMCCPLPQSGGASGGASGGTIDEWWNIANKSCLENGALYTDSKGSCVFTTPSTEKPPSQDIPYDQWLSTQCQGVPDGEYTFGTCLGGILTKIGAGLGITPAPAPAPAPAPTKSICHVTEHDTSNMGLFYTLHESCGVLGNYPTVDAAGQAANQAGYCWDRIGITGVHC